MKKNVQGEEEVKREQGHIHMSRFAAGQLRLSSAPMHMTQMEVVLTMCESGVFSSIFRFLPFGAGSSGVIGDLVMVIVRLMTCLTQTGSSPAPVADLGDSHFLRLASATGQSAGERADRRALLLGDSEAGDQIGD